MALFYDGKGNQIVIAEATGSPDLTYTLSTAWITNAESAYNSMLAEMQTLGNGAVPFFIQTDAHGRGGHPHRWLHNLDSRVKSINLGDVTSDYFNTRELTAFYGAVKDVDNKICVFGNHDIWTKSGSDKDANYYDLSEWFPSDGRRIEDKHSYFTVKDDSYNVKYIVLCPYYINLEYETNGTDMGIRTEQMEWLLGELSADDGYDIIVLMHQLFNDEHCNRDGTKQNWADSQPIFREVWEVLKDRRNKRSGTITDSDGQAHSYDFTNVKSRYLGSLHGHTHEELMYTEENTTAYACDWYGNSGACCFGLFDRENSKLKIWYFTSATVFEPLELSI